MFSLGNKIDLCGRDSNIFGIHLKKHNICDFKGLNTPGTSKSRKGVRMQHLVSVNAWLVSIDNGVSLSNLKGVFDLLKKKQRVLHDNSSYTMFDL